MDTIDSRGTPSSADATCCAIGARMLASWARMLEYGSMTRYGTARSCHSRQHPREATPRRLSSAFGKAARPSPVRPALPSNSTLMPQVQLIIDLVTPEVGRRRAERTVTLPGVPAVGEFIDTIPGPTLALAVRTVRWQAVEGSVTLFLGAGESKRPGITDHDGELALADYMVEDLIKAGWELGEYE